MKILLASPEVAPFAKTGGLADVAGALPRALAARGHDVAVVMPFYGCIDRVSVEPQPCLPEIRVDLPAGSRVASVYRAAMPGAERVAVYLIRDDGLFDRPQLYGENGRDYPDNALRFAYFSVAALWMLKGLGWTPDIVHCHDWQTALIPIDLAWHPVIGADPDLSRMRVLLTIHNLSYQGIFHRSTLDQLGLPPTLFHPELLEFYGNLNLLKGAILSSHRITTVSRRYAREIQTPEFGCGLEGVLRARSDRLTGILNGIDTERWNPETDPALPAHYSRADKRNKALCKRRVQEYFGLAAEPRTPLLAVISRLTNQKGLDLLADVLPPLLADASVQFVLLGTGQPEYHEFFTRLAADHRRCVGVELGFNENLAHLIEAGADIFLMPSQFEPCGLNQLYSLRYGTIPIVRRVGGLADSIVDASSTARIDAGRATGFSFGPYTARALRRTIDRALRLYRTDPARWAKLIDNAMAQDFSWDRSAAQYERLMRRMLRER